MADDEFEARSSGGGLPPLDKAEIAAVRCMPGMVRTPRRRPDSFRRSEASLAAQLARAAARGRRSQ